MPTLLRLRLRSACDDLITDHRGTTHVGEEEVDGMGKRGIEEGHHRLDHFVRYGAAIGEVVGGSGTGVLWLLQVVAFKRLDTSNA